MLNIRLESVASEQGPGMGGAMLAMVACGAYTTVADACEKIVRVSDMVQPDPNVALRYEERYQDFRKIYPACRKLFAQLVESEKRRGE